MLREALGATNGASHVAFRQARQFLVRLAPHSFIRRQSCRLPARKGEVRGKSVTGGSAPASSSERTAASRNRCPKAAGPVSTSYHQNADGPHSPNFGKVTDGVAISAARLLTPYSLMRRLASKHR